MQVCIAGYICMKKWVCVCVCVQRLFLPERLRSIYWCESGLSVAGMARPPAVCGHSAGGKPLCGAAVQWQEETHTNEMVPYTFFSSTLRFLPSLAVIIFLISVFLPLSFCLLLFLLLFSCQLSLYTPLSYSVSPLSVFFSRGRTGMLVWWWGSLVKFNTYLDYSYRFSAAWDVATFSLLVPLIHILWLTILCHVHRTECGIKMSSKMQPFNMNCGYESLRVTLV